MTKLSLYRVLDRYFLSMSHIKNSLNHIKCVYFLPFYADFYLFFFLYLSNDSLRFDKKRHILPYETHDASNPLLTCLKHSHKDQIIIKIIIQNPVQIEISKQTQKNRLSIDLHFHTRRLYICDKIYRECMSK